MNVHAASEEHMVIKMTVANAKAGLPILPPELKQLLDDFFAKAKVEWNAIMAVLPALSWFKLTPSVSAAAWQFIVNSILQLTGLVDDKGIPSAEKKATVLAYAAMLYEQIFLPTLPALLRAGAGLLEKPIMAALSGTIEEFVKLWHKDGEFALVKKAA